MEVAFTYRVTGHECWAEMEAACERAAALNKNFTGFAILPPGDEEEAGYVVLQSTGHDRSAITRRILAPIRSIFHRAKVAPERINLIEQRVLPNGRALTVAEGRTPKNTFADPSLREMMREHADKPATE
jgi:hypothetical protein